MLISLEQHTYTRIILVLPQRCSHRVVSFKMEVTKNKTDPWGYVVCLGTIVTFIAGVGHVNSFGLIYKDFILETNSSARSITTAHGVFAIMLAIGGLILNIMSKSKLLRTGSFIGAAIFIVGSLLNVIISNTGHLPLTFGMLQGMGFGMMVPVCYSTLNIYFVRRRTQVMSLIKGIQGFILIWYPQLMKMLLTSYGFRGTLVIIAAISLHTLPGMMTMIDKTTDKRRIARRINLANVENNENADLLQNTENSLQRNKPQNHSTTAKIVRSILEILNVKILKDLVYCNICVGQSFVNFSDLIFFILLPMLLQQYGYETNRIALCISISAAADVGGRFGLAALSSFVNVNPRVLFYVATFFTFVVILQITEIFWVVMVICVLGVLRALLHITSPVVISNHVAHEDFTAAYALFLLAAGIINVIFSPLVGTLKDINQDYIPAFYGVIACCIPCLILWPLEYAFRRK
ncbi:monocarboxylate transporter 6-like isoform X2 [Aricia agestis]|uniref:monocarboxylate transporter 6-like isoform X2 n=1 Tax=Aricia agestis TaxID=91739 RepID=UPI001C20C126|nr:monocarboxylate transporter 6-like isoform X2 [Aricia agestis]